MIVRKGPPSLPYSHDTAITQDTAKTRSNDSLGKHWDPEAYSTSLTERGPGCLTAGRRTHLGPHCHGEWVAGAAPATSPGGGRRGQAGGRAVPSQASLRGPGDSLHFLRVMNTLPDERHFWKSLVSSVRNCNTTRPVRQPPLLAPPPHGPGPPAKGEPRPELTPLARVPGPPRPPVPARSRATPSWAPQVRRRQQKPPAVTAGRLARAGRDFRFSCTSSVNPRVSRVALRLRARRLLPRLSRMRSDAFGGWTALSSYTVGCRRE